MLELESFVNKVKEKNLNVYGIIVKQNGEVLGEYRFRDSQFVHVYSISKSITSIAVGNAIEEGYFELEDKVIDFFADRNITNPSENLKNMTIENLLTMTTGHKPGTMEVFYFEDPKMVYDDIFLKAPVSEVPGTWFDYDNGATYILSHIIQKTTGMKLRDYLMPRLFKPLNIFNPQWDSCPLGVNKGYIGLQLTTKQLSDIAELLLNKGVWNGKRLIPQWYYEKMISKQVDNTGYWNEPETGAGYGYQIWMNTIPNSFRMDGLFGQYAIVLPDYNATVTINSHEEKAQVDILRVVWETVLPQLEKLR